jgi:hypothetical protein
MSALIGSIACREVKRGAGQARLELPSPTSVDLVDLLAAVYPAAYSHPTTSYFGIEFRVHLTQCDTCATPG